MGGVTSSHYHYPNLMILDGTKHNLYFTTSSHYHYPNSNSDHSQKRLKRLIANWWNNRGVSPGWSKGGPVQHSLPRHFLPLSPTKSTANFLFFSSVFIFCFLQGGAAVMILQQYKTFTTSSHYLSLSPTNSSANYMLRLLSVFSFACLFLLLLMLFFLFSPGWSSSDGPVALQNLFLSLPLSKYPTIKSFSTFSHYITLSETLPFPLSSYYPNYLPLCLVALT